MGFRKDKTTVAQTAANAAATVTAALVTAGCIQDPEAADEYFNSLWTRVFGLLGVVVDTDNDMFAEQEEKEKKAPSRRAWSKGKAKGTSITFEDAAATALGFGKFGSKDENGQPSGVTLGELLNMSEADCAKYGYDGDGIKYLKYLEKNEGNRYIARRAHIVLEALREEQGE